MKNFKKYISLLIVSCYVLNITSSETPSQAPYTPPVLVEPTVSPQSLEPRSLIVIIESGVNENALSWLYMGQKMNKALLNDLFSALTSDSQVPIITSGAVVKNMAIYNTIYNDFFNEDSTTLQTTYSGTAPFKDLSSIEAFKDMILFFQRDYTKIEGLAKTYASNPTTSNSNLLKAALQSSTTQNQTFINQNGEDAFYAAKTVFTSHYVYNNTKWATGKTQNGNFIFAPKDPSGNVIDFGFNYTQFEGLNGKSTIDPLSVSDLDPSTAYAPSMAHTENIIDDFKILTGLPQTKTMEPLRPLDIYLTGHGGPPQSIAEQISDLQTGISNLRIDNGARKVGTFLKWGSQSEQQAYNSMLTYLQEEVTTLQQSSIQESSSIGGLSDTAFNQQLVPALQSANTRTFTYETCFGGDVNSLKGWQDPVTQSIGTHSFTVINGALSLAPVTSTTGSYLHEAIALLKVPLNELNTSSTLSPCETRPFGNYFKNLISNIGNAVQKFFDRGGTTQDITNVTNIPQIKLATTDYWMPFTEISSDIMQISNIDAATGVANITPIQYNKSFNKGTILLSSSTLLTPLELSNSSIEMPHIVPMSIGTHLHYLDSVTLPMGAPVESFFQESFQPFHTQMAALPTTVEKTVVINKVLVGDKTYQVVITNDYALYLDPQAPLIRTGIDSGFKKDIDLKVVSLSGKSIPKSFKDLRKQFKDKLARGQNQALAENERLKVETTAWQTSLNTITDRRNLISILDKITGELRSKKGQQELDWASIADESTDTITQRITDVLKAQALDPNYVIRMSDDELSMLSDIMRNTVEQNSGAAPTEITQFTNDFKMVSDETTRRTLKQQLADRQKNGLNDITDWYSELTSDQQQLIRIDFDAVLGLVPFLNTSVDTLLQKDLTAMKDYIQAFIDRGTPVVQGVMLANLMQKIDANIQKGPNQTLLLEELHKRDQMQQEELLIDWITNLTPEEKALINTDIQTVFTQNRFYNIKPTILDNPSSLTLQELTALRDELAIIVQNPQFQNNSDIKTVLNRADSNLTNKFFDDIRKVHITDQGVEKALDDAINPPDPTNLSPFAQAYKALPANVRQDIALTEGKTDPYAGSATTPPNSGTVTPDPQQTVINDILAATTLDGLATIVTQAQTGGIDIANTPELETEFQKRQTDIVTAKMNLALTADELVAVAQDAMAHGIAVQPGTPLGDALQARRQTLINEASAGSSSATRTATGTGTVIDPTTQGGSSSSSNPDSGTATPKPSIQNPYSDWTMVDGAPVEPTEPGASATEEEQEEYQEELSDWEVVNKEWAEHLAEEQAASTQHGGTLPETGGDHPPASGDHPIP